MRILSRQVAIGLSVGVVAAGGGLLSQLGGSVAQTSATTGPRRACPRPADAIASAAPTTPQTLAARLAPDPVETGALASPDPYKTRIVVVEWKIKAGRECDFLDYWATRSTIPNRSGLVGEFLSEVDSQPWINWKLEEGYTTYYNVGIWRDAPAFQDQIGKYIDNNRAPLDFEAAKRSRMFLAPERWRIGAASLPASDPDGVR